MMIKEELMTDWKWIVGSLAVFGFLAYGLYTEKARQWHVEAVMNGSIRGNNGSRIYQVPTCPQYESIYADNIRLFRTIEEARSAGYRPAQNCGDDFQIREINETEEPDLLEHPGDPQYR